MTILLIRMASASPNAVSTCMRVYLRSSFSCGTGDCNSVGRAVWFESVRETRNETPEIAFCYLRPS